MTTQSTLVLSKTFTAPIVREHSAIPTRANLGQHDSTMDLHLHADGVTGFIEWDIPAIDEGAEIGLVFELDAAGQRALVDYDGVFDIPPQAVDLLREAGITVSNEYDRRVRFSVDGSVSDFYGFTIDNVDDEAACEWAASAKVGDVFPAFVNCTRVA